jgi:integrase
LTPPRQVRLRGKGRKERMLPIWHETADALHRLRNMNPSGDQQHVFVNHSGQPLTRDGVAYVLNKHVSAVAARDRPTLAHRRITPHVIRHYVSFRTMSGNSKAFWSFIGNIGSSRSQVLPIAQDSFVRIQESNGRVS